MDKYKNRGCSWDNIYNFPPDMSGVSTIHVDNGYTLLSTTKSTSCYLYRSVDSGLSWTKVLENQSGQVFNILPMEQGRYLSSSWVSPNTQYIYTSTDYGRTWSDIASITTNGLAAFCYLDDGHILAGGMSTGSAAAVIHSTDYGVEWTELSGIGAIPSMIASLCHLGSGIILAGQLIDSHIQRSTDYGYTWTDLGQQGSSTGIMDFLDLGGGTVLAALYDKNIMKSTNYGATWSYYSYIESVSCYLRHLKYLGNGIIIASMTGEGRLYRSTDYGLTWNELDDFFTKYHTTGFYCLGFDFNNHIGFAGTTDPAMLFRCNWYVLDRTRKWIPDNKTNTTPPYILEINNEYLKYTNKYI